MKRVAALDHLRGLSILGILMVNAIGFAQPPEVYGQPGLIPMTAADHIVRTVIEVFFHDKFITAFTLLFGISTFLVGAAPKILNRRLLWLAVFGLVHGALIWCGDILLLYAVCGLIFARWRFMAPRRLLSFGLIVFVVGTVTAEWPQAAIGIDPGEVARMRSGFLSSLSGNFAEWSAHFLPAVIAYLPVTLGGMMLGLGLFQSGFLRGEAPIRTYLLSLLGAVFSLGLTAWSTQAATSWTPMTDALLALPVMLGYAAGLILLARFDWGRLLLYPLACAGRMAFTNYLCQSLIMTMIFYGGRGPGLFGTMDYTDLVPIVGTIWIGQLVFSTLWLRWFRYGPFERVWRSLSYGKRVAISQ